MKSEAGINETIFIVDDEPANLKLLEKTLRSQGYEALILIDDPREVLVEYRVVRPDLILLDINMPHLDGYQVMEQLKALGDPLLPPIVILTAQHDKASLLRALAGGARDYLTKPFDLNELGMRVRNLLDAQMAHRFLYDNNNVLEELVSQRTAELQSAFKELEHQVTHDHLTGLSNRMLLEDRLDQAIRHAQRSNKLVAVLLLDLDRFKNVNDGYGHALGDELLCMVADRLKTTVRQTDTVARLGGDEFVVMLTEIDDLESVQMITAIILSALAKPYPLKGRRFNLTASVGGSLYPKDGREGSVLIRNADIAMYEAKKQGNHFSYYSEGMNRHVVATLDMENDLHQALANNELCLHYQPKVDLATGRIAGCEALLRWQHPHRGMVSPGMFIPIAEQTGLIVTIGTWVLEEACRQILAWQAQGQPAVRIAVNLSARQFRQGDLVATVRAVLERHGLDPGLLELELTESMIMDDPENTRQILQELRAIGITLSLDDFGTGYSSLNYLRHFPVDSLKIDQSFIREVTTDPSGASVVASIIDIAHNLKLIAIAEGVETQEQLEFLVAKECDAVQGYLFSKPLPAQDFARLLQQDQLLKRGA